MDNIPLVTRLTRFVDAVRNSPGSRAISLFMFDVANSPLGKRGWFYPDGKKMRFSEFRHQLESGWLPNSRITAKGTYFGPGVSLVNSHFHDLDLAGADLSNADLSGSSFTLVDLTAANLQGAKLDGADFSRTNLSFANLTGANVVGTNFNGASLFGATLPSGPHHS